MARSNLAGLVLSLIVSGCYERASAASSEAEVAVPVGVVTLAAQTVPLTSELPGRTVAYEVADVRPQVSGIIESRVFREGGKVRRGQTLYRIDARAYRAAAAVARANLRSAAAAREGARTKLARYKRLKDDHLVSEQEQLDRETAARQAEAAVEQARALLQVANINLGYTKVVAPISGRVGRSRVTPGALVTAEQVDPLCTIQRLDPMWVDLQQASIDMFALRNALGRHEAEPGSADVSLELEDGSRYEVTGTLQFAEPSVDSTTGAVTLRARFDNPRGALLPGMYVRARIEQARAPSGILAPQAGVARDPKGHASALVLGDDGKVVLREVQVARAIGNHWLIKAGLNAGDRLIVEGTGKVKPGQMVTAVPVPDKGAERRPDATDRRGPT